MLNLENLENKLDTALEAETSESLTKWIMENKTKETNQSPQCPASELKRGLCLPNFTEGEWDVSEKGIVFKWGNGPETPDYRPCIAQVSIWKDGEEEGKANAKAISAVPEMIDALLEFVNCGAGPTCAANKAKDALKKAGVFDG